MEGETGETGETTESRRKSLSSHSILGSFAVGSTYQEPVIEYYSTVSYGVRHDAVVLQESNRVQ